MLAVLWIAYILSFFHRFAPSGITTQLEDSLNIQATTLGILAGAYFFVYTLMQIPAGIILDALGTRLLLLLGGLIAGIGSLVFGVATNFELALIARILVGLGVSVVFLSILKVFTQTFAEHQFSTMVGITIFIGNIGSVLAGYPLSAMAEIINWRYIFIFLGCLSILIAIGSWLIIPQNIIQSSSTATSKNLTNTKTSTLLQKLIFANKGLFLIIKNPRSFPPAIVNGALAGCLYGFGGLWISPWLNNVIQIPRTTSGGSGVIISIYFLGFALGGLILGKLSDKLRNRTRIIKFASFCHLLIFIYLSFGIVSSYTVISIIMFFLGLSVSAFTLTWASIKEVNPTWLSGTSTSFANMAGFLVGGLIQLMFGYILDHQQQLLLLINLTPNWHDPATVYFLPMLLLVATAAIGFVCSFFITETYAKGMDK